MTKTKGRTKKDGGLANSLTLTALAERRGVSVATVSVRVRRLVEKGLLKTKVIGRRRMVDPVAFDRACEATRNPAYDGRSERAKPIDGSKATAAARIDFALARMRREFFTAEIARLGLEQRIHGLCDAHETLRRQREVVRLVRDRMLAFPESVAARVAAVPDETSIRIILDVALREALTSLANELERAAGS